MNHDTETEFINGAENGWKAASVVAGSNYSADIGHKYAENVNKAIEDFKNNLIKRKSEQSDAVLGGILAEEWHAGTFNINAAVAESKSKATVLNSKEKWSVDIELRTEKNETINYQSKYCSTAKETATKQSLLNTDTRKRGYGTQKALNPSDQNEEVKKAALKRALKNEDTRPDVAKSYRETAELSTDTITDGKVKSKKLTKKDSERLARDVKNDRLDLDNYNINTNSAIKLENVLKKSVKAGFSAAVVSSALKTAPELYKCLDYLIKTGQINVEQLRKTGTTALESGSEGFLNGYIAAFLQIMCEKGAFGAILKNVDPTSIGTMVSLTIETVKIVISAASGKIEVREMSNQIVDNISVSLACLAGMKIGAAIGSACNIVGMVVGSLIGSILASVYSIGKKRLISLCVDTGFTLFGLVDQDYTLPDEVLKEIGVETIKIDEIQVDYTSVDEIKVENVCVDEIKLETVKLTLLKRGLIAPTKVAYVM